MTAPFGPALEASLKRPVQGARFTAHRGGRIYPSFSCCISGGPVGLDKDPVALMTVFPTRACMNAPISVDYSRSYSPSSSLDSWEVDWGDGNTSNGIWPGAGSVAHPFGGYAWPGPYRVVLTVYDQLGAHGEAAVEVEIIDCDVWPGDPLILVGGCGASGGWLSTDAGINWLSMSPDLAGLEIYDLKVNLMGGGRIAWAATEQGLYVSKDYGVHWTLCVLPGAENGFAYALAPSAVSTMELHTLVDTGTGQIRMYRTTNGGLTWDSLLITGSDPGWQQIGDGVTNDPVYALHWLDHFRQMFIGGYSPWWDGVNFIGAGYWWRNEFVLLPETNEIVFCFHERPTRNMWIAGAPFEWGAGDWRSIMEYNQFTTEPVDDGPAELLFNTFTMCDFHGDVFVGGLASGAGRNLYYWDGAVWNETTPHLVGTGPYCMASDNHYLYIGGDFSVYGQGTGIRLARWNGFEFTGYGTTGTIYPNSYVYCMRIDPEDNLWIGGAFTTLYGLSAYRVAKWDTHTETWSTVSAGNERLNGVVRAMAISPDGVVYVGGEFTATLGGTTLNRIAWWDESAGAWQPMGTGANGTIYAMEFDDTGALWIGGSFTEIDGNAIDYLARYSMGTPIIPTEGRFHLMDMSKDGNYVFAGLLRDTGSPFIARVARDLSSFDRVYTPGSGSWGGVVCDPLRSNVLWIFGDFGNVKVRGSADWGDNWVDLTAGAWGGSELVRPVLPSWWNSDDLIAILNDAQDCYHSQNAGSTWQKRSDTPFVVDCGARDPWEPQNAWIGRVTPGGVTHIQYSPNAGGRWFERSDGFEPNAPVTALQVVA